MHQMICIAGATGTGKTALALKIAHQLNTKILSCDSVQIFSELNIGSNKERDNHLMIDVKGYGEKYDVQKYVNDSLAVINEMEERARLPVRVLVVGGCGLYMERLSRCYESVVKVFLFKNREVLYRELDRRCEEMVLNGLLEETLLVCVGGNFNGDRTATDREKRLISADELEEGIVSAGHSKRGVGGSFQDVEDGCRNGNNEVLKGSVGNRNFAGNGEKSRIDSTTVANEEIARRGSEHLINMSIDAAKQDKCSSTSTQLLPIGYKESYNFLMAGDYSYGAFKAFLNTFKKNTRNYVRRQETFFKRKNYVFVNAEREDLMEKVLRIINGERAGDEYTFKYFKMMKEYKSEEKHFKTEEEYEAFRKRCYYLG
ncbi:hypothetical protein VCUG_01977 [Vavraia culicis subsp. floridensis]|uniref:tRNA dimethylallyltransferase n=1 Tax=Vavraia culicis (isolate floridensis) TaxID=948595 RepID=L2GSD8_VAVCU|nr:uncharacterized protein VCUG_01977 [Vavraia culicis subsp. floridensis]ELA46544.2 hypothetical protein VCUG_01977 [Vavraia culicis subsp. floridensis]